MKSISKALISVAGSALLLAIGLSAQEQTKPSVAAVDLAAARQDSSELRRYFDNNPLLRSVVARDPSLLSDEPYIQRTDPFVAKYLQGHPEIAKNPEYYTRDIHIGPYSNAPDDSPTGDFVRGLFPFLVFLFVLFGLMYVLRAVLESSRWNRIVRVQTEAHNKLLDRFGNAAELSAYMGTEAGRRFLEAPQFSSGAEMGGSHLAGRSLLSLQMGVVLTLAGLGLLYIRNSVPDGASPLLILGTLGLTLGLGFLISALVSLALARRLGMLPEAAAARAAGPRS